MERFSIMRLSGLVCVIAVLSGGCSAAESNTAKCQVAGAMASPGGGPLLKEKGAPYVVDFTAVDVDLDGKISAIEFKGACQGGWVKDPSRSKSEEVRKLERSLKLSYGAV